MRIAYLCLMMLPLTGAAQPALEKRWDLTIKTPSETYPSWLGVTEENGATVVRVVGRVGSAHIALNVQNRNGQLSFQTKEWFQKETLVTWSLQPDMSGVQKREDGVEGQVTAVRAPALDRPFPEKWTTPEKLFDGASLNGWSPDDPAQNHWKAAGGILINEAPGANLSTTRKFTDFKLHVEFLCPEGCNSGVYLRGRYEIQIEYSSPKVDPLHAMGSVYGFIAPSPKRAIPEHPGEWETYDISLVGRRVTAYRDGIQILDAEEIPGITGGALDSNEAEPGPIYLQGDHTGGLKFRNITISVPAGQ